MNDFVLYAIEFGLIAGLFTGLLIYVLRDARKREQKYQEIISKHLRQIHEDLVEIKSSMKKGGKQDDTPNPRHNQKNRRNGPQHT